MRWLFPIIAIPLPLFFLIPLAIVSATQTGSWKAVVAESDEFTFWFGLLFGIAGLVVAAWSVGLFAFKGDGTVAPWDPPQNFVATGPYLYVRNPMMLGAFAILLSESLLLQSYPLFIWFVLAVAAMAYYVPHVEERELEERFGNDYLAYKKDVHRWLPRPKPWEGR